MIKKQRISGVELFRLVAFFLEEFSDPISKMEDEDEQKLLLDFMAFTFEGGAFVLVDEDVLGHVDEEINGLDENYIGEWCWVDPGYDPGEIVLQSVHHLTNWASEDSGNNFYYQLVCALERLTEYTAKNGREV
jgi:hypothetical protein